MEMGEDKDPWPLLLLPMVVSKDEDVYSYKAVNHYNNSQILYF